MSNIHYQDCPVCGSRAIHRIFSVKDHTVSQQSFVIVECDNCTLRFTQDVPDQDSIVAYYKSENYISHTNTSRGLINQLYKLVRKKTLSDKRKLVEKLTGVTKGNLLDMGSGTGSFAQTMREHGWNVTGLEPDEGARRVALQHYEIELLPIERFHQLDAGSYDAITLWHVLEHVHELQTSIQQLKRLLKDNGRLLIAVPNYTSLDAEIYQDSWAAYDVPRHLYHFSPRAMEELMGINGLMIEQYLPMWYDSFYISMLSSQYKTGRSRLLASFWNGLRSNLKAWSNSGKCSSLIYVVKKMQ